MWITGHRTTLTKAYTKAQRYIQLLHDRHTILRCLHEGEESFKRFGYADPRGCPYRDRERSLAWHRGVFRADHAHAGRQVLELNDELADILRELRLADSSIKAFAGEY